MNLQEAIAAFQAALLEVTRERVPIDWAMVQTNLGIALGALGKRTQRADLITEALTAIRAALAVCTQAGMSWYEDALVTRIETLETTIATMEGG